jgi:hypothetical protein
MLAAALAVLKRISFGGGGSGLSGVNSMKRAGLAGLAVTNALAVTGLMHWAVRCLSLVEVTS